MKFMALWFFHGVVQQLLIILSLAYFLQAQIQYHSIAQVSTSWTNNNLSIPSPFGSVRIILLNKKPDAVITQNRIMSPVQSITSFACGFYSYHGKNYNPTYFAIGIAKISKSETSGEKIMSFGNLIWVANRNKPVRENATLDLLQDGNLVLKDADGTLIWSTGTSDMSVIGMKMMETGNLVLYNSKNETVWQSFDYPTDTLLPGMKLGVDLKTGLDRYITSWKNKDDPSPGDFVWRMKLHNNPEYNVLVGSKIIYRAGPWNGISYSGNPRLKSNNLYDFDFINNENEVYYIYRMKNKSVLSRIVLNQSNYKRERYMSVQLSKSWHLYAYAPMDLCDNYNYCGAYGNCDPSASPMCQCLKGFKPKSPENSNSGDLSQGCNPIKPLNCSSDGFYKFIGLKMPDTTYSWVNKSMNLKECRDVCLKNCSCSAYTSFDIRNGGSGCSLWFKDLIDIRQVPIGGQDLYVRMSASEVAELYAKDESRKKKLALIILIIALVLGILILSYYFCKNRTKFLGKVVNWKYKTENKDEVDGRSEGSEEEIDLPLFDFVTISQATNKFSISNKVGEGGFGPVYKGTLLNGQEIAVKRLSSNSGQGLNEFKNEVKLIVKLQHRNLVKLLGCCIQGNERLLIYEYMPNKSLDFFIFDQRRGKQLDWPKRLNIVCGIARGIMYLHQDSRLRIIHRDLKASNILLDNEMNPKVSDFGMARTFGGDQTEGNTNRVVGTYGYMAPEYASDGLFSVKSDVFSFGVLMLEIITGKKSRGFYYQNHSLNLIGYAWRLWKEGKYLELIDPILRESCYISELKRCIHISLLCVQHYSGDRPSMGSVVLMLGSEIELAEPKEPGFFKEKGPLESESSSSKIESSSTNEISFSLLEAR